MNTFYLFPGKLAAFSEETIISTLLGSCVAVALHDPTTGIGGLNHYLLPEGLPDERANYRYAFFAIPGLVDECVRLGANRSRIQAKIYGGGNVINMSQIGDSIGKRNIEVAESMLKEMGIPIIERNIGGISARTIKLNSKTFEVRHLSTKEGGSEGLVDISGFKPLSVAKNVKVLIVDDSATVRTLFTNIFKKSGLEVVGAAADPYQARELILNHKPDVMTLDIEMPKMSGVTFLEKIMKHHPIATVMVSSLSSTGEAAMRSLELGAVEFIHKPSQFDPAVLKDLAVSLVDKVRAAASVNILKKIKEMPTTAMPKPISSGGAIRRTAELKLVVVGGNAGSADSLEKFIKGLAADTPPVVVSCSTVAAFLSAYTSKLKMVSKVTPVIAKNGEFLRMGHVYFVPTEHHGKIQIGPSGPILNLHKGSPVCSQVPSSTVLFMSAAESYGKGVYGVLLGGFGIDGVEGLTEIQKRGGATVVQNPEEAQFPYGPQKAVEIGVVDEVLNSQELAVHLMQYRNQNLY